MLGEKGRKKLGIYLQLSSVSGAILCRNSGFIFGLLFCFFKHSNNNDNNEVLNPTCWHKLHEFLCLKRKKRNNETSPLFVPSASTQVPFCLPLLP